MISPIIVKSKFFRIITDMKRKIISVFVAEQKLVKILKIVILVEISNSC